MKFKDMPYERVDFDKVAEEFSVTEGRVVMSVVDVIPPEQIEASRQVAESLGAVLRVRTYDE